MDLLNNFLSSNPNLAPILYLVIFIAIGVAVFKLVKNILAVVLTLLLLMYLLNSGFLSNAEKNIKEGSIEEFPPYEAFESAVDYFLKKDINKENIEIQGRKALELIEKRQEEEKRERKEE